MNPWIKTNYRKWAKHFMCCTAMKCFRKKICTFSNILQEIWSLCFVPCVAQCPGFSCSISAQWRVWQHLCQVQKSQWLYTQSSTYCRIQTIANSTWQKKEPLIQDIPTRWNSTFNMIKSICRNKPHIKFVIPITAETDKLQTGNETRCLQVNLTEHILSFRPIFF